MLKVLWLEIKNYLKGNKAVFILSLLAFTCACVTLNTTIYNFLEARDFQKAYEESYGNKVFYRTMLDGQTEVYRRVFGSDNKENIKTAFDQLKNDPLFEYRYRIENSIEFFDLNNPNFGADDFPKYKPEFLTGYETGWAYSIDDDYISLKCLYADRLLRNEPNLNLSSGRWFTDGDFYVHDPNYINLPVILGADYRDLYEIGDTITNARIGTEAYAATLHVIGFLEKDSWFYDNNNDRLILNRYMVVPSPEVAYDFILDDGSYCEFFMASYGTGKMINARIVIQTQNANAATQRVYQIFNNNLLYEFNLNDETSDAQSGLRYYREQTVSNMTITVFTLLLCILMFSIQANYKLNKYKKKYGIYMMSGITARQLLAVMLQDMLLLFAASNILTLIISNNVLMYFVNLTEGRIGAPPVSVQTVIVILAMELVLLCYMGLSGHIKVHKTDMSAALREHE